MKWFESFLNKPITKIFRIDNEENYSLLHPNAFLIMFDETNGLLIGVVNDGESIIVEASTLSHVYDYYGIEYLEKILNELRPEDKLNRLLEQPIKEIRITAHSTKQVIGDNFIMKDEKYKSVSLKVADTKISFHNSSGGHLEYE